jgi:hypothetical protein
MLSSSSLRHLLFNRLFQKGVVIALLLTGGCATRPAADLLIGPGYEPTNIYGRGWRTFNNLRRVAVLPIAGRDVPEAGQLNAVILSEVSKVGVFEAVAVTPEQMREWTGQPALAPASPVPARVLQNLREKMGCDGVFFAEITSFKPYPPLVMGWKLRLVELGKGETLWAADEVFDASDPAVSNGARRYHRERSPVTGALADSKAILLSPSNFARYSISTLVATLDSK